MGIPSYFGYLLKNHNNIFKKLSHLQNVDNFYIDANAIIYNSIKCSLEYFDINKITYEKDKFEERLIDNTINKLKYLIKLVKPRKNVIIAFDGPAPLAKVHQQKTRRFKNSYLNKKFSKGFSWDTCAISPGTLFMKNLDSKLEKHFDKESCKLFRLSKFILFPSYQIGEGEHKIFSYIRSNIEQHKDFTTIIYGLDADLIMLSLTHLQYTKEIYLYRDSVTSDNQNKNNNQSNKNNNQSNKNNSIAQDDNNFFRVNDLAIEIINVLTDNYTNHDLQTEENKQLIDDYIFMCFMLGNDFMPHFPALNIRLNAIDKLVNIYSEHFYKKKLKLVYKLLETNKENNNPDSEDEYISNDLKYKIDNKNFKEFVRLLSENEEKFLINLESNRLKFENNYKRNNVIDLNDENILNNLPVFERNIEKYINPSEHKWERRYYYSLFDIDLELDEENFNNKIRKIVNNYLEMIVWTLNYYNDECVNWRLHYKYNYPPLLSDLFRFIPYFDNEIVLQREINPYHSICGLVYIIPPTSYHLLPKAVQDYMNTNFNASNYDINSMNFVYAYSRYFWESHIIDEYIEKIDINVIEKDLLKLC
jgi:5'-3' exonuclease